MKADPTPGGRGGGVPSLWAGVWRLADPKISLASFASLWVGLAAAAADGPFSPLWALATVAGIFCVEVGKNASGEVVDFDTGADLGVADADRSPFSGGKRVIVDGLVSRRQTTGIAAVSYLLALAIGLAIAGWREPWVVPLALAGLALAYFYHAPPLKLSYRGWGELAVGLSYGPLIATGAYLVQRGRISLEVVLLGLPLGVMIAAFLWVNEFPDFEADRAAGKRTWVVRLGRGRASRGFGWLYGAAFAMAAAFGMSGLAPAGLAGLIGGPPAVSAVRTLRRHFDRTPQVVPAQSRALLAFVLYALGTGAALLALA